ncbi:AlbA family DNA-binding domain-containing protein [Streptomyces rimosus]|uniref:AlbA family DNA-binding domain-containing protein n=1 Tax=Streptomyces rimosus TaxID=1927 RepID=UPI0004C07AA1|nr:RNA-binding domain-containing protein [Streptomyces rimosus]
MPFPIDATKAFRYPSELRRLVEAVRSAGDCDETRWIEWKSTLDLTTTAHIQHVAKQLLGFANRDPETAEKWAQGHAYLVIGASPQELKGVAPIDPERLVSQVRPYVGSEITWTPEYVRVDDTDVLVIIVDPPHPGHSIHLVRKDLQRYKPGTVLIRRPGQTEAADVDEMAMLQRRLLTRTAQVELTVEPLRTTIEACPDFQAVLDTWIAGERAARLDAWAKRRPGSDHRTDKQHRREMDRFLEQARAILLARGIRRFARYKPSMLALRMVNPSERNFTLVRVTLTVNGISVRKLNKRLFDLLDEDEPDLPGPISLPVQWEAGRRDAVGCSDLDGEPFRIEHFGAARSGWQTSTAGDKAHIVFAPCDLRPHETVDLPPVPLGLAAKPGTTVNVAWEATATNADCKAVGSIAVSATSESTFFTSKARKKDRHG